MIIIQKQVLQTNILIFENTLLSHKTTSNFNHINMATNCKTMKTKKQIQTYFLIIYEDFFHCLSPANINYGNYLWYFYRIRQVTTLVSCFLCMSGKNYKINKKLFNIVTKLLSNNVVSRVTLSILHVKIILTTMISHSYYY